jgi:LPXTG-motif cell wall-anchored protein
MSRRIRQIGILAVASLVALFALLPVAGAAPRAAETKNVTVKNFEFAPKEITVNVGDTVMWHNDGPSPHTVTASDGSFDSGNMDAGKDFSFTFTKAGTFSYVCKYHDIMQATVTVQEAGAPAAAPAPAPAQPAAQPAQADAVDVDNQPIANGSITVGEIYAYQDGWIVAHLDEGGAPGKVLGFSPVKKGESNNVAIKLSQDVPAGGKLWPMLHVDAGTIGTYEFPGADVPVKDAAGNVVMKQFTVTAAGGAQAGAGQPSTLPRTGGDDAPVAAVLAALALLGAGGALVLRLRRRGA